jgi:DNA-binding transcriptional regulator YiaG
MGTKSKSVSPLARLTAADVRFIRHHPDMRQVNLAAKFQVTQATISNVITRRTYKQVA